MSVRWWLRLCLALLLSGCAAVGPDHERPAIDLPGAYPEAPVDLSAAAVPAEWWKLYGDQRLDQLVASALERNADMRIAVARIEETDANLREAGAAFLPEVDLGATPSRSRISNQTANPVPASVPLVRNNVRLALSTAFELDFWGKLRRALEATRALALGSRYAKEVVTLSLALSGIAGVFIFGIKSLLIIIASIASAVITEAIILAFRRKDLKAVYDGSAFLTGLLLAYNLPPQVPVWMPVAGSFFAIAFGKQAFGGLGHNIFNPALVGRAFLMISWPVYMTTWQAPRWSVDAVTGATPLALYKQGEAAIMKSVSYWDLFIGNRGGCIGEVCVVALLVAAAYLFLKKYISWHTPFTYIAVLAFLSWAFNGRSGLFTGDALFFTLSGGLILGAFFMATDYVTGPLSSRGKIIFGVGCGALTFLIRKFAGYPEGVSYAILIMNAFTPVIDRYTFPKWFGWRRE